MGWMDQFTPEDERRQAEWEEWIEKCECEGHEDNPWCPVHGDPEVIGVVG